MIMTKVSRQWVTEDEVHDFVEWYMSTHCRICGYELQDLDRQGECVDCRTFVPAGWGF